MKKQIFNIVIIATSTIIAGIINYFYHPIILRYLSVEEFAEIESLLSLLNLISVLFGAISLFLVKEMVKNDNKINSISNFSFKYGSYVGIFVYLIFILLSPLLSSFLKFDNIYLFLILGLTILFGFSGLYQGAFFQSIGKFNIISGSNILNALFRLIFSLGLVILGLGIYGAVWGLIVGQLTMFIIFLLLIKKIRKNYSDSKIEEKIIFEDFITQKKQIFNYILGAIIIAFLMNADILFAKHFFDNKNAGIFAGISVIGKLLLFVVFSIETVYYPILTKDKYINKSKIIKLSVLYILSVLVSILFFYIFGNKLLYIFMPGFEKYLSLLYIIFIYCGAVGFISLIIKILIAFQKYKINFAFSFYLIFFIISMYIFDLKNIYNFGLIFLFNILIGLFICLLSLYLTRKD